MPEHTEQGQAEKAALPQLGPLLCWAVVFADIGTSIYYVPGILYATVNKLAGFFVLLTMIVFVLLTFKYVEVTYRFPQGGGVVTVATRAMNKWFGALGGMFILVDYFLTAAISCLSGMLYLSVVLPAIGPHTVILGLSLTLWITLGILILLGFLNWLGVSESARVSMIAAIIAFLSDVAILVTVFTHLSFSAFLVLIPQMFQGSNVTVVTLLIGFSGAFLAFSGLESISQLAPVMKLPRRAVGRVALALVVITVGLTSPVLTLLSTMLLPKEAADPVLSSQLISLLGGKWGGPILQTEVAVSASALLVFASNTAIIGSYHVFLALSRMEFFPEFILRRNKLRGTPHYSIALATLVPIAVLVIVHGNINILGDMYAFGLLGAFSLTCLSMDIVRHRDRRFRQQLKRQHPPVTNPQEIEQRVLAEEKKEEATQSPQQAADPHVQKYEQPEAAGVWTRSSFNFYLGILTTFLVLLAWTTNLIAKPLATAFGGTVAVVGMLVAYLNYRRHKSRGRIPVVTTGVEQGFQTGVLAVLTAHDEQQDRAVVETALHTKQQRPVVFLYLGTDGSHRQPEIFRLVESHLNDMQARRFLGWVNNQADQAHVACRFVYRHESPVHIVDVYKMVRPQEVILSEEQGLHLQDSSFQQRYVEEKDDERIMHLVK